MIGYARVSSLDQDYSSQIEKLKAAGAAKVYAEKKTGTKLKGRYELEKLVDGLREGDVVLVVKMDRLGRDLLDILKTIETIDQKGCFVRLLDQGLDTSTTWGKHSVKLLGWVAEVEMSLRRERQAAGVQRAKAEGKYQGRKRKAVPERIAELKAKGMKMSAIARELKVSRQALYKAMATTAA